jgi:hypothetical protein
MKKEIEVAYSSPLDLFVFDYEQVNKKNHPCPLLEGRRGTVPFSCT